MFNNIRGKDLKDTETAIETTIFPPDMINTIVHKTSCIMDKTITAQLLNENNFDTLIEKRNNKK